MYHSEGRLSNPNVKYFIHTHMRRTPIIPNHSVPHLLYMSHPLNTIYHIYHSTDHDTAWAVLLPRCTYVGTAYNAGFPRMFCRLVSRVQTLSCSSTKDTNNMGVTVKKNVSAELAVNGNIGSAGESIQSVNQEISRTSGMRRGVVYSAGGFVLVLSLLYVLVGFYALGKDDGNGKAGGARMRGWEIIIETPQVRT